MTGKRGPLIDRFNDKFVKRDEDDCWYWTAKRNNHGYGMISPGQPHMTKGGFKLAHHVPFFLEHGRWPKGVPTEIIKHTCDRPMCVNPKHLVVGTQRENLQERTQRGRFRSVVMTEDQAYIAVGWFALGYGPAWVSRRMSISLYAVKQLYQRRTRTYLSW